MQISTKVCFPAKCIWSPVIDDHVFISYMYYQLDAVDFLFASEQQ